MAKAPAVPELGVLPGALARLAHRSLPTVAYLAILYSSPQRSLHCIPLTSPQGVQGSGGGVVWGFGAGGEGGQRFGRWVVRGGGGAG